MFAAGVEQLLIDIMISISRYSVNRLYRPADNTAPLMAFGDSLTLPERETYNTSELGNFCVCLSISAYVSSAEREAIMIFRRLMTIQWKNVFGMSRALAKRSGRSSASVFFDFVDCYRKRGATWFNYMNFAFDLKRDPAIRDTYATEYKDNGVMFRCNAPEIIESIRDKGLFNAAYREFIGRDYIDLRKTDREDYERFIARFDEVFAKPALGCGGDGIERLTRDEAKGQYDRLVREGRVVVEEVVRQHSALNAVNASSVNTIRTCTCINDQGDVTVLYMVFRIGRKSSFVDNMSAGGLYTKLSDDGRIIHPCYSAVGFGTVYTHHPDTNLPFVGIQLPMIDQVKELVIRAAKKNPGTRYIGWDVAITPDGPVIIEANERPGCDLPQTFAHSDTGRGLVDAYEKALSIKLR